MIGINVYWLDVLLGLLASNYALSYRSMLCLKYTSHEIAAAVVHFSTVRLSLVPTNIPEGSGVRTWSDILRTDVSEDVIQSTFSYHRSLFTVPLFIFKFIVFSF